MAQKDLIPLGNRTVEQAKEIARQGGIASGKSRRRKKLLKDIVNGLLNSKCIDEEIIDEVIKIYPKMSRDDVTNNIGLAFRVFKKGLDTGDFRAFEAIRDTAGQKPIIKQEITEDKEQNAVITIIGKDDIYYDKNGIPRAIGAGGQEEAVLVEGVNFTPVFNGGDDDDNGEIEYFD